MAAINMSTSRIPEQPQSFYSGFTTIGGYRYVTNPNATIAFGTDRIRETAWAGVELRGWSLEACRCLLLLQPELLPECHAGETCAAATNAAVRSTALSEVGRHNCSGDFNQGSFLIDYTFNKHLDVYAGVTFTEQNGGLNNGFLADNTWAFASGLRVKW